MKVKAIDEDLYLDERKIKLKNLVDNKQLEEKLKQVILWTNSNPATSFSLQTITTQDMADYDIIGIWFWRNTNNDVLQEVKVRNYHKTLGTIASAGFGGGSFGYFESGTTYIQSRAFSILSDTQISFNNGYLNNNIDNSRAIPMYVVGYKDSVLND